MEPGPRCWTPGQCPSNALPLLGGGLNHPLTGHGTTPSVDVTLLAGSSSRAHCLRGLSALWVRPGPLGSSETGDTGGCFTTREWLRTGARMVVASAREADVAPAWGAVTTRGVPASPAGVSCCPILQMRKPRLRERKRRAQARTALVPQSQDWGWTCI